MRYFLKRLRSRDHLPLLENYHTQMSSTWDRSGGNKDGADYQNILGNINVLLDTKGPGCIHRLFTGLLGAAVSGTRIQIILDEQKSPLFDLPVNTFFSETQSPLPFPLMSVRTYPGSLFPIPFAKHIRIQLVSEQTPKNWGVCWQIALSSYSASAPIKSLTWPLDDNTREELDRVLWQWEIANKHAPEPPDPWPKKHRLDVAPTQSAQVHLTGLGIIEQMRVSITPNTPEMLQKTRLQIFWDGNQYPSVDVPLGFFFGNGYYGDDPLARFDSMFIGAAKDESYSLLPMPFETGADIRLTNTSKETAVRATLKLDLKRPRMLPENCGRLHATWRHRRAAVPSSPRFGPQNIPGHTILDQKGRGKYVGALVHLQWPYPIAWWGEGDWLIWTDENAWPPSYHGTGSEEYFNSGWTLFDRKAISGFVKHRPEPVTVYSFHLNDAFPFQSNIRVAEETVGSLGGEEVIPQTHPQWGSTAFWYAWPPRHADSDRN